MKIRDIPQNVKPILPATALYNTLREQSALRQAERERLQGELDALAGPMGRLALSIYRHGKNLSAITEGTKGSFPAIENALRDCGVTFRDYTGQAVTDELLERVSIEGWEAGTEPIELVSETFTPEISWRGEIVQMAQVFCRRARVDPEPEAMPEAELEPENEHLPAPEAATEPVPMPEPETVPELSRWQRFKSRLREIFFR